MRIGRRGQSIRLDSDRSAVLNCCRLRPSTRPIVVVTTLKTEKNLTVPNETVTDSINSIYEYGKISE